MCMGMCVSPSICIGIGTCTCIRFVLDTVWEGLNAWEDGIGLCIGMGIAIRIHSHRPIR